MTDQGKIDVDSFDGYVVFTINHPSARNALTDALLEELADLVEKADADANVRTIVFAGSDKVFASGADLSSLAERSAMDAIDGTRARNWSRIRELRTPTVAAVSGFCLGGGAELAMMSDVVIAAQNLKLGFPETMLGLLPGAGGTQMLPRAVGKTVAMDMILTGRMLSADEAREMGVVARIAADNDWLELAKKVASDISARPAVAQKLAKRAVDNAFESTLATGLESERTLFSTAFSSEDATEGISAFLEKRTAEWTHM